MSKSNKLFLIHFKRVLQWKKGKMLFLSFMFGFSLTHTWDPKLSSLCYVMLLRSLTNAYTLHFDSYMHKIRYYPFVLDFMGVFHLIVLFCSRIFLFSVVLKKNTVRSKFSPDHLPRICLDIFFAKIFSAYFIKDTWTDLNYMITSSSKEPHKLLNQRRHFNNALFFITKMWNELMGWSNDIFLTKTICSFFHPILSMLKKPRS